MLHIVLAAALAIVVPYLLLTRKRDRGSPRTPAAPEFAPPPEGAAVRCFTPAKLRGLTLRNRIIRAAAYGGSEEEDLVKTHVDVARGGVGMTTIAYASISSAGRTFEKQVVLDESFRDMLTRLCAAVHGHGAAIAIQLTHSGAFADPSITRVPSLAPSRIFNEGGFNWCREMTTEDLAQHRAEFARAALLAVACGFDALELHFGHGYLLSQFLSPSTNRRKDRYGGSIENRMRFPLEVLHAVRAAIGEAVPIIVKMNMNDGFAGGLELPDAIEVAKAIEQTGEADMLVLSGGFVSRNGFYMLRGTTPLLSLARAMPGWAKGLAVLLFGPFFVPTVPFEECFFRDEARTILKAVRRIPLCIIGGVTRLSHIEGALHEGFEFVQMARALIREPDLVLKMRRELEESQRSSGKPENAAQAEQQPAGSSGRGTSRAQGNEPAVFWPPRHGDVQSKCIHCNECVIGTIAGGGTYCPERLKDIEDS